MKPAPFEAWTWFGSMWWAAGALALVAAWWGAGRRRRLRPTLFAVVTFAASVFAGIVVGGIVVAAVASLASRSKRTATRIRRGVGTAIFAVAACAAAHRAIIGNTWGIEALVATAALVATLIPGRRPHLDPQRTFTPSQRSAISERDGYRCAYCGVDGEAPGVQLAVDHVTAHSRGGRTHIDNGKLACTPCNLLKSDHTWPEFERRFVRRHGFRPGQFDRPSLLRHLFV